MCIRGVQKFFINSVFLLSFALFCFSVLLFLPYIYFPTKMLKLQCEVKQQGWYILPSNQTTKV